MSTFYLLSGMTLGFVGVCCFLYVLFHAAMNHAWNRSAMWLLTGAGFVYYVIFEFDTQYRWPVFIGAVGGLGLGTKLFMMGSGLNL